MTPSDRSLFEFYLATLENRVGAELNDVSAKEWAGGLSNLLKGQAFMVKEGMGKLIESLQVIKEDHYNRRCYVYEIMQTLKPEGSTEMRVRYNQTTQFHYQQTLSSSDDGSVEHEIGSGDFGEQLDDSTTAGRIAKNYSTITVDGVKDDDVETVNVMVRADAVICTVPLGILKVCCNKIG